MSPSCLRICEVTDNGYLASSMPSIRRTKKISINFQRWNGIALLLSWIFLINCVRYEDFPKWPMQLGWAVYISMDWCTILRPKRLIDYWEGSRTSRIGRRFFNSAWFITIIGRFGSSMWVPSICPKSTGTNPASCYHFTANFDVFRFI